MAAATDNQTLPHPPDEIESQTRANRVSDNASGQPSALARFAPAGQLTLYGHAGQLSVDGATYSTARVPETSPEGASPYLGTLHGGLPQAIQTGTDAGTPCRAESSDAGDLTELRYDGADVPPDTYERQIRAQLSPTRARAKQLELPVELVDNAPQLSMWRRLAIAHELTYGERQSKCMWVRRIGSDAPVEARRHESGAYTLHGLVRCGLAVCPHCGGQKARATTSALAVAMTRHLEGHAATDETAIAELVGSSTKWRDVAMLTLAPPHRIQDDLGEHTTRLYDATSKFFRSRTWEHFSSRYGVVAKVRALDATHGGPNGSHVHFHVALFLTNAAIPSEFVARFRARQPEHARLVEEWELWDAARSDWHRKRGKAKRQRVEMLGGRIGYVSDDEFTLENARAFRSTKEQLEAHRAEEREYTKSLLATMEAVAGELGETGLARFIPLETLREQPQALREAWLAELGRELVPAWEHACRSVGIAIDYPGAFRAHALKLSPAEHAWSYFAKWGLADEVGASTAKDRNHLRLLDAVGAGVDHAGDVYLEFARATKGKQWITGLADTCKRYAVTDEDALAYRAELRRKRDLEREQRGEPVIVIKPLKVLIYPHVYDGALSKGWDAVFAFVDDVDARGGDVQGELDAWLYTARLEHAAGSRAGPAPPDS